MKHNKLFLLFVLLVGFGFSGFSQAPALSVDGTFPTVLDCIDTDFGIKSMGNTSPPGAMVLAKITLADPSQVPGVVKLQYYETAGTPGWADLSFNASGVAYFGPGASGFPYTDNYVSQFRLINENTGTTPLTFAGATVTIFTFGDATEAPIATLTVGTGMTVNPTTTVDPITTPLTAYDGASLDLSSAVTNVYSSYTYEFFSDAGGTAPVTAPVTTSGPYYVQATSSCGTLSAIVPITVTFLPCYTPEIVHDLPQMIACAGERTILRVAATDAVSYAWFENGIQIPYADEDTYVIPSAQPNTTYQVKVINGCGTETAGEVMTLQVVKPLPKTLAINGIPSTVYPNDSCIVSVGDGAGDFAGVMTYSWSFDSEDAKVFSVDSLDSNHAKLVAGSLPGSGLLSVEIDHVCGKHTVSQEIVIAQKITTGIGGVLSGRSVAYSSLVVDALNIQSETVVKEVYVTDLNGRLIYSSKPQSKSCSISASGWSKGIYVVRIITADTAVSGKIIKK